MGKWTTIKVPKDVYSQFKAMREKYGKATWRVLLESISFYDQITRKTALKAELPDIEKISWYITKLATSFGAFKENPSEQNLEYLRRRVKELRERLGVDASALLVLAEKYMKTKDILEARKLRTDLNAAFKMVIKELLTKSFLEEQQ